jgi:hypothetical protein
MFKAVIARVTDRFAEIAHEAERHIDDAAFGHNNSMQEAKS